MAPSAGGIKAGKAFILIEARDMTARTLKKVGTQLRSWGRRMNEIGTSIMRNALIMLTPTALSVRTFANFDDAMRRVEARSTGTAREMEALREQAKELGRTTSFTASQVADLQAKLAQKGFDRRQVNDMTKAILDLARAAGTGDPGDTVLAADLVSGVIRAFRMEASDATAVADVLTDTVNNSNFSLQGLVDSMSKAAPIAKQYNVTLEDTAAVLAAMTAVNIEASMAGTGFRNLLLKASANGEDFNTTLKELTGNTVKFQDEAGNLRNLPQLLFDIGEATKELGTAVKGELLADLFGLRAIVPALAATAGKNEFEFLSKMLLKADGAAARTAKTMDDGLGGSFRKTFSALEGLAISVGEAVDGPLSALLAWLTDAFRAGALWVEKNQEFIWAMAGSLTSALAFGAGLVVVGTALSALGLIISGIGSLFSFAFSVPGLAAIAAVSAAIWAFKDNVMTIGSSIESGLKDALAPFKKVIEGVTTATKAGDAELAGEIAATGFALGLSKGKKAITDVWRDIVGSVWSWWQKMGEDLLMLIIAVGGEAEKLWKKAVGVSETAGRVIGSIPPSLVLRASYGDEEAEAEIRRRVADLKAQKRGMEGQDAKSAFDAAMATVMQARRDREDKGERDKEERDKPDPAIEDLGKKLDDLLTQAEDTADKAGLELMPGLDEILGPDAPAADAVAKGMEEAAKPVFARDLPLGLEKGSIEAAQQFQRNRMNLAESTGIDKVAKETERTADATEETRDIARSIDEDFAAFLADGVL